MKNLNKILIGGLVLIGSFMLSGKVEAAEYKYPVYPNSPEWEAIDIQNEIRTLIVADGFSIYKVLSVGDKSNGNFSMKK